MSFISGSALTRFRNASSHASCGNADMLFYVCDGSCVVLGALHGSASSRNKNAEAGGASRLQIFMRLCSGRQRVGTADPDLHNPGRNGAEQRVRTPQQLASVSGMGHEGWTCDVERVEPVKLEYVEGGNGSRGGAKRDQWSARGQAAKRLFERILADRIEHRRDAIALRQSPDRPDEILRAVDDCRVAAVRTGDFSFLLGPDCANDRCAKVLGPLAKNEADPACRGMDQHGVTSRDRERGEYQIVGGDSLGENRRRE